MDVKPSVGRSQLIWQAAMAPFASDMALIDTFFKRCILHTLIMHGTYTRNDLLLLGKGTFQRERERFLIFARRSNESGNSENFPPDDDSRNGDAGFLRLPIKNPLFIPNFQ